MFGHIHPSMLKCRNILGMILKLECRNVWNWIILRDITADKNIKKLIGIISGSVRLYN